MTKAFEEFWDEHIFNITTFHTFNTYNTFPYIETNKSNKSKNDILSVKFDSIIKKKLVNLISENNDDNSPNEFDIKETTQKKNIFFVIKVIKELEEQKKK